MRELLYRLRIIFPQWLVTLFFSFVLILCFVVVISLIPNLNTIPIFKKAHAFKEALVWETRAFMHSEDGFMALIKGRSSYEPSSEAGGIFLGVTKSGNLLIDTYTKENDVEAVLADLIIDDAAGVARFMDKYKYQHVLMDIYEIKGVVMYIVRLRDGVPLNLLLIQENLAHAHPNPPTSIVDSMMATYWWNIFNDKVIYHEIN